MACLPWLDGCVPLLEQDRDHGTSKRPRIAPGACVLTTLRRPVSPGRAACVPSLRGGMDYAAHSSILSLLRTPRQEVGYPPALVCPMRPGACSAPSGAGELTVLCRDWQKLF